MKIVWLGAICAAVAAGTPAPPPLGLPPAAPAADAMVAAPTYRVDDGWVTDNITEVGTSGFEEHRERDQIERVDGETMVLGAKKDGSPSGFEDHMVGTDLSHRQLVDGQMAATMRPLDFPLRVGKSWSVDYVDSVRRGAQISVHIKRTFTVAGWDDIAVPAGIFHAIRIEAHGVDDAIREVPAMAMAAGAVGSGGGAMMGRSRKGGLVHLLRETNDVLWYVPAVRNWGKTIEEQYTPDGVRSQRITKVLVSYQLGG